MFKGKSNNPKRQSTQDAPRNTTYIDALGNTGSNIPVPTAANNIRAEANKETRPATVKAELFLNLGHSVGSRQKEDNEPTSRLGSNNPYAQKRASVVLPPSINLAMNNNTRTDAPPLPSRSDSAPLDYDSGSDNKKATPGGSVTPVNAKGWGFEFLDHPPPTSNLVEEPKTDTHSEFNKMLDELQIPSTLRPKLQGLDVPVKAAMLRSSHVLTMPGPHSSAEAETSPTKSKFGKDKEKTKDKKSLREKDKFKTENFSQPESKHPVNPFMPSRNGTPKKGTPKKGPLRRTQSSGSLGDSPRGIPYSQTKPGNGSQYNLAFGDGQEGALRFMFPSLQDDPFARPDSPPLMPPPTLAQLQGGFVGHVRGSSFDSASAIPRPDSAGGSPRAVKLSSGSPVFHHGNGSSSAMGTSNGSQSGSWGNSGSSGSGHGAPMTHGNGSRVRVGSGSYGQTVLVKDRSAANQDTKYGTYKERDWTPAKFSSMLAQTKSVELEVERLKKLRIMLRNEAATWSENFLIEGGYSALLSRLNDMLEVEWREEQRDDQILHELLRCFKALSTSSIGCFALRSSSPRPFVQLVSLLYSDKKPGDVCSRVLIIELLQILTELYPTESSVPERPSSALGLTTTPRSAPAALPRPQHPLPSPHANLFSLMRAVLLTPKPLPSECPSLPISPHAFIESLHHPRIYKDYLKEVSDICRDYFWVFCHPANAIWNMEAVDVAKVEAPKAPGGMTGGVEFEAMQYLTTHYKLINSIARATADLQLPPDNELSAQKFHNDMFMSGIEKIISTSRRASTVYYPTLHLEIARYIELVREAGMELPYGIQRLIGSPPAGLCKPGYEPNPPNAKSTPSKDKAKETKHVRGVSAAPVLTAVGNGGYQGQQSNLPKGAAAPVLPVPNF